MEAIERVSQNGDMSQASARETRRQPGRQADSQIEKDKETGRQTE